MLEGRQEGRLEGRQEGLTEAIEGLLRAGFGWPAIQSATGIDERYLTVASQTRLRFNVHGIRPLAPPIGPRRGWVFGRVPAPLFAVRRARRP